jgi:hypothetical protein
MKIMKYFTIFVFVLCLCQTAFAEKRVKPLPMKELTDPSSHNYVPIPYPKNRKEIIEDLNYAAKKFFGRNLSKYIEGEVPRIRIIMEQFAKGNSEYKVGEIIKVKIRTHRAADEYAWLILLRGKNGEIAARLSMNANGLLGGATPTAKAAEYYRKKYPNLHVGPQYLKTESEVIESLSEDLGRLVDKNEIKKMERVGFPSTLGFLDVPMFEIKMKSGKMYYYSVKRVTSYEIDKKISWKKNKEGYRESAYRLVPRDTDFLPDSINDEIIVLKKLKKKE